MDVLRVTEVACRGLWLSGTWPCQYGIRKLRGPPSGGRRAIVHLMLQKRLSGSCRLLIALLRCNGKVSRREGSIKVTMGAVAGIGDAMFIEEGSVFQVRSLCKFGV